MADKERMAISISNSGVILLWPFLTTFFKALSMVDNGDFLDNASRHRAVYLLQNLVFDHIDFPEHELTLNKLLVGLNIEEELTPTTHLTDSEKELCTSLLHGFKANWDKVQNVSIEAIQETFFQREGMLGIDHEKTTLHIEKKGVDVLLESIPWNISMIKLPWMTKLLLVEWI